MSSLLGQARSRVLRQVEGWPRPHLTVVPRATARVSRIPFAVLVVAVLTLGLVGLLVLNTTLQQRSYLISDLQSKAQSLSSRQQSLQLQVANLKTPQRLAQEALKTGMVPAGTPGYLSLRTGKILGVAAPGAATEKFVVTWDTTTGPARPPKSHPVSAGTYNSGTTGTITHHPKVRVAKVKRSADTRGHSPNSATAAAKNEQDR